MVNIKLEEGLKLTNKEVVSILKDDSRENMQNLSKAAFDICKKYYGDGIFIRGLIEYSNYCREDCYYCGIQRSNKNIKRFRLSFDEIINAVNFGYKLGFRTFVLQGGEDPALDDDFFIKIIKEIKKLYKESRITLSIGKRSFESLKMMKEAGADRFLLRHEAANKECFSKLHPESQSRDARIKMLYDLKKLGYATGSGFMIGAPFQRVEDLVEDIRFLQELEPEMIGVGPFIPHHDTIFKDFSPGDLNLSLRIVALLRIIFPKALIPSTTALNSIDQNGRILGIMYGANVAMPNLSPEKAKNNYQLYDNKANTNLESAEYIEALDREFRKIGKKIVIDVGDPIGGKQ